MENEMKEGIQVNQGIDGKHGKQGKQGNEAFYQLLKSLQEIDFVLVELNLFLDTHPNDMQALQQFNQMVQQRWQLAQEYESNYGPLMNFGHSYSRYPWQWNDTPWPWQV